MDAIAREASHHIHHVIGSTDANDPHKIATEAMHGTLEHSITFAITRRLQTGEFDNDCSYRMTAAEKDALCQLMVKIEIRFDQRWEDLCHDPNPHV